VLLEVFESSSSNEAGTGRSNLLFTEWSLGSYKAAKATQRP
jgi:hypothetical protein